MVPNLHVNPLFERCEHCLIDATEEKVAKKKKILRRVDSLKIGLMVAAGFGVELEDACVCPGAGPRPLGLVCI